MSEMFPARTIAVEVIACTDETRMWEFNHWYDKVHVPELRNIPGILSVSRYRDMVPDFGELAASFMAPAGQPVRHLTVYRINWPDPWGLLQKVKEDDAKRAREGKMVDCLKSHELSVWDFVAYRSSVQPPQRPETKLPDGMPEAMLMVYTVTQPGKELDHDDWWLNTHAHDLLETPGLVQCSRFRNLNPKPAENEATRLNLYEIDSDDPVAVCKRIFSDDRTVRRPSGRMTPSTFSHQAESYARGLYQHWDLM
ncbi:MAG: hypothetical protein HY671_07545 [Chloroflexi bacterium]|nr:hypothetical protein [Chloroflexota bacterium]